MGGLEIIAVAAFIFFASIVHLVVFLVSNSQGRKWPRPVLVIYGIPGCYVLGALVTPPDFISAMIVGSALSIVYAIGAEAFILLRRRYAA